MELTSKQEEGLRIALERYKNHEKYTVISGYAGAGKTTLVKFIVEALVGLGVDKEKIGYATYTGKAAQVLIDKGNKNAVTLHKLLYKVRLMPNGHYKFEPKPVIEYDVVIVDECSMAPASIIKQLAKHKCYCIFCGDPGQLPPVSKDDDNHLLDHPHVFLDEIMRQAQDSGIIRLSMLIRNGAPIGGFSSDDAKVISSSHITDEELLKADINLCATNATRNKLNQYIRHLKGFDGDIPNENEKVICLHNEWDDISFGGNALTNGCIGYLTNIYESNIAYPYWVYKKRYLPVICGNFVTETNDDFGNLYLDKGIFKDGNTTLLDTDKFKVKKAKLTLPKEFDYAYAITCHKAQGAQWDNVLVLEEGFPYSREEHARWLYTAVTRASKNVIVYSKA